MAGNSVSRRMIPWLYDLVLWLFTWSLNLFFREVYPRGAWRIPEKSPVLIVAAPHANQFVDSGILMHLLKSQARRRVSFLIAQKSMNEPYIGTLASCMGALPVVRSMDLTKPGQGSIYQPHPHSDPALIHGVDTDFTQPPFMSGGSLTVRGPDGPMAASIEEIEGPTVLRLKKAFASPVPNDPGRKGTSFKIAPHVDQSQMFDAVYKELSNGGCIGIFPEGGSHDRSNLLPLKAGAALMSLGALARDPGCGLSIVPCGMNYFHAHKFRSRAVIEFGRPIHVHPDQVEAFKMGGNSKRNAVGSLLETIYDGLEAVTQISPDHETLILVQSTRKLYNPISKKLPLPLVIEFNRRLLKGYTRHRHDPRIQGLKKAVKEYNRRLESLGIKDHQVEWGNLEEKPWWLTLITLLYRLCKLSVLSIGTLPGVLLFWPVFVTTKVISEKKRRLALAASVVKLQGHDVVSTWKILVAMGLAPTLYAYYTIIVTAWLRYNRYDGYYTQSVPWWLVARTYVPDGVSLGAFAVIFFGLMISVSFAALRFGEIGMDIIKSLPPLLVALNPLSSSSLADLRDSREALAERVTDTINELGFGILPDDVDADIPTDPYKADAYQSHLKSIPPSEPSSRERSSSRSSGFADQTRLKGLTSLPTEDDLEEVDDKIRAFKSRGRRQTFSGFEPGESILKILNHKPPSGKAEGKKER
ncbi:acyltransferase [Penicillium riverlandense]|uniref:acyltransferase n=1 Tax=Penicillium riverlandense TaxID=1903569 RepID=UPI00254981D6|nr:acyltransferase [Penicillium riverlandense]KAJ5833876.1 acyltransferase [Penicillium riverlandense]